LAAESRALTCLESCEVTPVLLVPWLRFIKEILMLGKLSGNKDKEFTYKATIGRAKSSRNNIKACIIGHWIVTPGIKFRGIALSIGRKFLTENLKGL